MRGFLQLAPLFRAAVISQAVGDAARRGGTTNMNAIPHWSTGSQRHTLHGPGLTGSRTSPNHYSQFNKSPKSESMYEYLIICGSVNPAVNVIVLQNTIVLYFY